MQRSPFSFRKDKALRRRLDRPVVLVGMMGSGKSSLGRRLAQRLDLRFADADSADLRLRVDVAEYLGTETVLNGKLGGSGQAVTAAVGGELGTLAGQEIGLSIDPAHLHVFDAETGLNLAN